MVNYISMLYSRIYFYIRPPKINIGQYWYIKDCYGRITKILIKEIDGKVVTIKDMALNPSIILLVNQIRWIRLVSNSTDE